MAGQFQVSPQALHAKGRYEENRAQVIDGLKEQIQQARATEDCFGLIGMTAGFFTGYDDMVGAVEENVGKAAEYLRSAGDCVISCADDYQSLDEALAAAFTTAAGGGA
ncbi:hypothetical protein [Actinokineospora sp.]|uniref:hypothetical protein n=1 Tax=Actinokineospora sp. TaxID=1872133 RepID=UPI003D6AD738